MTIIDRKKTFTFVLITDTTDRFISKYSANHYEFDILHIENDAK